MGVQVTWLGHASALIEAGATRVITDPALTARLAHLRRHSAVDPAAISRIDLVLISHLHLDHLHRPSLRLLGDRVDEAEVVVPAGAGALLRRWGHRRVREVRAGDHVEHGDVTVDVVPAAHSDRRGPHTRRRAEAVGYVVRSADAAVYFAGDTDLFAGMGELGPVDLALLPIWGWGASLGEGHLDPARAARAAERIRPRLVVPIHWGTYSPVALRRGAARWLDCPAHQFAAAMATRGETARLHLIRPGGTLSVTAVTPVAPVRPVRPVRPVIPPPPSTSGPSSLAVPRA